MREIDSSESIRTEIQNLIQKLQGLTIRLENCQDHDPEVIELHDNLLMTAEGLQQLLLLRSQDLNLLEMQTHVSP